MANEKQTPPGQVLGNAVLLVVPPLFPLLLLKHWTATAFLFAVVNVLLAPIVTTLIGLGQQYCVAGLSLLLGDRPAYIQIGIGKLLGSLRRRITVAFHAVPILGATVVVTARKQGQRLRHLVAYLVSSGLVAGCVIAVVLVFDISWKDLQHSMTTRAAPDSLFIVYGPWFVFYGVIEGVGRVTKPTVLSGQRKLGYLLAADELLVQGKYEDLIRLARAALDDQPEVAVLQAYVGVAERSLGRATTVDVRAVLDSELPAFDKLLAQNLWAWQCYLDQDDSLRESASKASAAAASSAPDNAAVLDTRGHVLLWEGNLAEAEAHLLRAYNAKTAGKRTRASAAAGLAIVCVSRDRMGEAKRWLAFAIDGEANERILARAKAAVEPLQRI